MNATARTASSSAPSGPPGALRLLLEGRAPWEYAALRLARPWLRRLPRGDGHPVVVFPGLAAHDVTTLPLRRFLRAQGWDAQPWRQGFNLGPREGVLSASVRQVRELAERHGGPVSLIGWSLGGIYAREIAKELPALARCVVTLGSPVAGHPRATNAWRLFEWVSGQDVHDPEVLARIQEAPPVPTTSIWSRSDGIVAWQCSVVEPSPIAENVRLPASHCGMGLNPLAFAVIADRLAQPPGGWRPFEPRGLQRLLLRP